MTKSDRLNICLGFFAVAQFVSISADRLKQFALVGMLSLLAPGSSFELLKLSLFTQVPLLLFAPLFGTLIDKWNKSGVIVASGAIRALLVAVIPAIYIWTGSIYTFHAFAFVLSIADLMFAPARSALIPEVVAPKRLLQVNAVFWGLGIVGTMLGFLLGGWLFDYRSWETSFVVNGVVYVSAAVLMLPVWLLHRPAPHPQVDRTTNGDAGPKLLSGIKSMIDSIKDGSRLIRSNKHIAVCLLTQSGVFGVAGILYVIGIARIQEVAPAGKTLFLSAVGASLLGGLLLGSWLASVFRKTSSIQRTVAVSALAAGVAIVGIARTETIIPMSVWAAALGLAMSPVFILTETLLQEHSPPGYRGRVFAAREVLIKSAYLATAITATAADAVLSKATILTAVGLFLALLGVVLERTKWLKV